MAKTSANKKPLWKVKQVLSGDWHQWEGEDIKKGCRRVNVVEI
jgi:hypothetical protein